MHDKAMSNLGYDRVENDFYVTPDWCVEVLLRFWQPTVGYHDNVILEPACGDGAISNVLKKHGYSVDSFDIVDHGYGLVQDFFEWNPNTLGVEYMAIITNPPFGRVAYPFVEKAIKHVKDGDVGSCAFLLRNEWDCAKTREHLWNDYCFSSKIVLTKRPLWFKHKISSPRHNYAWYVWDNYTERNDRGKIYHGS